jgi:hypothetical protein
MRVYREANQVSDMGHICGGKGESTQGSGIFIFCFIYFCILGYYENTYYLYNLKKTKAKELLKA